MTLRNFAWDAETFGVDMTGQPLRYKVLIKNEKVFAILYNNGVKIERLKHKEYRIESKEPVLMRFEQEKITAAVEHTGDLYGIISNIPVTTMACKDEKDKSKYKTGELIADRKTGYCGTRGAMEWPGWVDFHILSNDGLGSVKDCGLVSVPICMLYEATSEEK
jgi:hypothetical protein